MISTVPLVAELIAPSQWRTVACISDLHLQASEPATFDAWQRSMANLAADALFILGDLFEVWVGDDLLEADPTGFEAACMQVLRETAHQRPVYFMHGNRDFLVGRACLDACDVTLLDDPTVLQFAEQRWLLSHGDALCLEDVDYLQFRAMVRSPQWQQEFLAKPLPERQHIARAIRSQSENRKRSEVVYVDVDTGAAIAWLQAARAKLLVHGHTHRPARHALDNGLDKSLQRWVLSDWDVCVHPPRGELLYLSATGVQRVPLD